MEISIEGGEGAYDDGHREGYADAETGRRISNLDGFDPEWARGYIDGQAASWGAVEVAR